MSDFDFNDDDFNLDGEEDFSPIFEEWDSARKAGLPPGYFDSDELCEIIDTYLSLDQVTESRDAIAHAIKLHPKHEDMVLDIMQMLGDYELWNDLLDITGRYKHLQQVWNDGHRLTALLHLSMEDEAFFLFREAKKKYAPNKSDLAIIYQAMAEALYDVDLYEAAIEVIEEILQKHKDIENEDLLWIQLQSYLAMKDIESVQLLCEEIQKSNPMDADTWSRLGLIYKEIKEKEKSIDAFEFAASLGKKEPIDVLNLIYSYKENENFIKALEKADEYLEKFPNDYIINTLAATLCLEIENWEKALKYADNALAVDARSDFLYLYKSQCFANMGNIKSAIDTLELGIKENGDVTGELLRELSRLKDESPNCA